MYKVTHECQILYYVVYTKQNIARKGKMSPLSYKDHTRAYMVYLLIEHVVFTVRYQIGIIIVQVGWLGHLFVFCLGQILPEQVLWSILSRRHFSFLTMLT
jgi:hypothetical protein